MRQLSEAFNEADSVNEALREIRELRQGTKIAEDHNTAFKLLVGKAGVRNAGDIVLIDYYRNTLNPRLLQKILSMEVVPTTIQNWYDRAVVFDNNHRRMMSALGKKMPQTSIPGKKIVHLQQTKQGSQCHGH